MAKLHRKPHSQQRLVLVAENEISGFSCGHVCEVGGLGIAWTMHGVGAQKNYNFQLAMTYEEWEDLKAKVDGMFEGLKQRE